MREAVLHGASRVLGKLRSIHRLQREVPEGQVLEALRLCLRLDLWIYELQLVTAEKLKRRAGLGTHADPIEIVGRALSSVRLDRHFESLLVERIDERLVELEQRLAAGAHDIRNSQFRAACGPERRHSRRELARGGELPSVRSDAYKVGVAELTDGLVAISFTSRPQVAAAEPTEHGWAAGVKAFTLKCVKDFLDGVHRC